MRERKSPQEKKRLSLEKDRRNAYLENDKASRKSIPLAKARVNRANRRAETVALTEALGAQDTGRAEHADDAIEGRRRKRWRKQPDEALGVKLARQQGKPPPDGFDPSKSTWH